MIYTLVDAKPFVARFVQTGGTCASGAVVTNRINEAVRRLLMKSDWTKTQQYMKFLTYSDILTLPREVEAARLVDIQGSPTRIFSRSYEFLESGPGAECCDHYGVNLKDLGDGYPTFFDIPCFDVDPATDPVTKETYRLFAIGNENAALGLTITINGRTEDGSEVHSLGVPGESLVIANWAGGVEGAVKNYPTPVTTNVFTSISDIRLPTGRTDYVTLYAVNETTRHMYFLGKYHPDETIPDYRRYRILGYKPDYVEENVCVCLYMLVKLRYLPASRDTDILLIQNLDAIKNMVMAIRDENSGNLQSSIVYEQKAVALLAQQQANSEMGQEPELNVPDNYGYGQVARYFR